MSAEENSSQASQKETCRVCNGTRRKDGVLAADWVGATSLLAAACNSTGKKPKRQAWSRPGSTTVPRPWISSSVRGFDVARGRVLCIELLFDS